MEEKKLEKLKSKNAQIILAGVVIGAISVALVMLGNPKNMGFCIACFLRDMAGSVGMHRAAVVQYMRPEIIGLVLGALIMSLFGKEFKSGGGSAPFTRFILGAFVTIGALMFLGCPLRMILRIAGGDLNAIVGLVGFVVGILIGIYFLNKGFSLSRTYKQSKFEGLAISGVQLGFLALLLFAPAVLIFSEKGPGSMHAPIFISLAAGLLVGAFCQKTRLCMVGGIRDAVLFKDFYLLYGFLAIGVTTFVGNLLTKNFNMGFMAQPIAHTDAVWNILGMVLVGFASVLLGGCPLRQLILAGSGNSDSAITVAGLFVGAAFAHNFSLASSGEGATSMGKVAVIIGIAIAFAIAISNIQKESN
ncbi:MAG: YedE family putative selenium transporter [Oscillospiraceae bacterium]